MLLRHPQTSSNRAQANSVLQLAALLFLLSWLLPAQGFEIDGSKWPGGEIEFYVDLSGEGASGLGYNFAFISALNEWSDSTDFNFIVKRSYRDPCANDSVNSVDFTDDVCGTEYGANTVAVTLSKFTFQVLGPPQIVESDIVVNQQRNYNVYEGNIVQFGVPGIDFRRVALHELGHALGLGHEEDQPAIMAANIGDIDQLQADDIEGVNTLYGGLANCVIRPLAFGFVENALAEGDCTVDQLTIGVDDSSLIDIYQFQLTATSQVSFDMVSSQLDSVLLLADASLRFIGFDDKSSGLCNSTLSRFLPAGNYFLLANTFVEPQKSDCGNTGGYQIYSGFDGPDLLQLGPGSSVLLEDVSAAAFSGGVTANNGSRYGNRFKPTDSLDVQARIDVDPLHQGQAGFLVVAAILDGEILLLNQSGQFVGFDPAAPLLVRAANKQLAAVEDISIVENLVAAQFGIQSISIDFLVGYGLDSTPQQLYYHQTPLNLTIDP